MRALSLLACLALSSSGCTGDSLPSARAQDVAITSSGIAWTSSLARSAYEGREAAPTLALGVGSLSDTKFAWSETAQVTTCARCARHETGVYGANPRTHVYKPGGAHVWSGCHACLVEILEAHR